MNDAITKELRIIDYTDGGVAELHPTKENTQPLPEAFGRNLDTLEKARLWLTNPHNWHRGKLFVLKWNGLHVTVMEEHARKLMDNPEDDGLPWVVVTEQKKRKSKSAKGESMEEPETLQEE